jgi:hypothetical protein
MEHNNPIHDVANTSTKVPETFYMIGSPMKMLKRWQSKLCSVFLVYSVCLSVCLSVSPSLRRKDGRIHTQTNTYRERDTGERGRERDREEREREKEREGKERGRERERKRKGEKEIGKRQRDRERERDREKREDFQDCENAILDYASEEESRLFLCSISIKVKLSVTLTIEQ